MFGAEAEAANATVLGDGVGDGVLVGARLLRDPGVVGDPDRGVVVPRGVDGV